MKALYITYIILLSIDGSLSDIKSVHDDNLNVQIHSLLTCVLR
jgi:hypothetical protein